MNRRDFFRATVAAALTVRQFGGLCAETGKTVFFKADNFTFTKPTPPVNRINLEVERGFTCTVPEDRSDVSFVFSCRKGTWTYYRDGRAERVS